MNLHKNKLIAAAVLLTGLAVGCKKESANIFNMFDVTLTLNQSQPHAIDENAELSETDSALIDYTIVSPTKDMYQVNIMKGGATTPYIKIPITEDGKRRSFSGKLTLYAKDLGAGSSSFRIWPIDKEGVYLGDGNKNITINVLSNMKYFSNRRVFLPDSVGKVNESYLSFNEGKTYSYTTGQANAAKIDFGIYRDTVRVGTVLSNKYFLYSLSETPSPFKAYDISAWTKRATLFSAPVTGSAANFRTMFNTSKKIEDEAKKKPVNLKHITTGLAANQFIYFLTPEGKYGVLYIQSITYDFSSKQFLAVSYKIQN
ncbi:MAG: hypothetical protein V4722_24675 [Bacteroidota bacterium]